MQETLSEYAERTGKTLASVRKAVQRGKLAAHKIDGIWYVDEVVGPETKAETTPETEPKSYDVSQRPRLILSKRQAEYKFLAEFAEAMNRQEDAQMVTSLEIQRLVNRVEELTSEIAEMRRVSEMPLWDRLKQKMGWGGR